ncbi:nitrogen fixation protein FixH [Rhodomicrobium udaipurense JA643]|uniref:FixH family protein n=1 Tax=Rhodomicrobium udaipurense TaxID=1202716 RepID=A0A8I1KIT2_9HYPH|nr:FixH family protein [Rhodomicrobium udaipurense]KAI93748.1 nitrogen fixation protein FixH [Rhodomicrobium udaipurense JA643]MBJ7542982.1 FixH family protein [Rhodomicrobium udaipurense]
MSTTTTPAKSGGLTGKHVLLILLGFFGVMSAANAIFVYMAISTKPGEATGASYEAGLRYNQTLAEAQAQAALGWHHKVEVRGERLRVSMTDASGAPVAGLAISGHVERPASSEKSHRVSFKEIDAGLYEADLKHADMGKWILAFNAEKSRPGSAPAIYRVKERLWLEPSQQTN